MSLLAAFALIGGLVALGTVVFVAMLALFARLTGWRRLASRYAAHGRPVRAERFRVSGALIGEFGWSTPPLRVALDDEALWLRPVWPFRPMFAPLAIPWAAVAGFDRRRYLLGDVVRLRVGVEDRPADLVGFVSSPVATAIEQRVPPAENFHI